LTFVFLAILVMAWAIVFLPAVQRAAKQTPLRSAEHFRRGMQVIAPAYEQVPLHPQTGRRVAGQPRSMPTTRARELPTRARRPAPVARRSVSARSRRQLHRQALGVLLTMAGWSAIAALFLGGAFWELHVAIDASIGLYAIYLVEEKRRAMERSAKVRTLRRPPLRPARQLPIARPTDIRLFETLAAVEEG
jgi:hypothetical protein